MSKVFTAFTLVGLAFVAVATPAHASVVQVPEPTTLGLIAAGAAVVGIAARLRRRK